MRTRSRVLPLLLLATAWGAPGRAPPCRGWPPPSKSGCFLEGLAGDSSGAVTAQGLFDYLKPKVQDAAALQNRDQTPVLDGCRGGELVRFPGPSSAEPRVKASRRP